ncbi:tripartite tricarboxylate transporter substrate binding protein [Rhizobium sp. CG5]|uniref:Bug family tripartite tricarboxylate transporter substrate binding protein n=1 Tax=Rhizobium sp. CG5 TaxID=2726076 RepID=UPI0020342ED3|nr:tripartite tricarboxylate transporter substrate binding protein [Rhizobium sp. CG5]MCM2474388.1 tripartite tricarboxylate transporter substrate binding protein [Rhizobium sp. CG5]
MQKLVKAAALTFGLLAGVTGQTAAQTYPDRTIQIIVPYAPGGQGDITARLVAEHLSPALGQPVIVENRPGANGSIGSTFVARAEPDGYTLEVVVQSHVLGKALIPNLPYDPATSFEPISLMARTQVGLVVPAALPVNSLAEFVEYVKQRPGQLGFASAGIGSNVHIFSEWFLDIAGLDMVHAPYAGSAAAHPDLISGVATMAFDTLPSVSGLVRQGRLKLLAVGGKERSPEFPDVPTVAESGYGDYNASSWSAMLAPAGTPKAVIDRLNAEVVKILAKPEVKDRLAKLGATVVASSPDEARKTIASEGETFSALIKRLDLAAK